MSDRVLITGATGLLGQAVAAAFFDGHAKLALHYRNDSGMAARLVEQAGKAGNQAVAVQQEFDNEDADGSTAHFLARVHVEIGTPNIAILNAAAQTVQPWSELRAADWDDMYRASFRSTAVLLQQLSSQMAKLDDQNRVVVLVGSIEGIRPAPAHAAYAAMKAAVHHLVLAAAHELGPQGVRVVGVAPGLIDRPGLDSEWPEGVARWNQSAALGRPLTATEVASAIHFLSSAAASGITGVVLPVDAGWSAHPGW